GYTEVGSKVLPLFWNLQPPPESPTGRRALFLCAAVQARTPRRRDARHSVVSSSFEVPSIRKMIVRYITATIGGCVITIAMLLGMNQIAERFKERDPTRYFG